MKDRFGSEVKAGDIVATDTISGGWLYAKIIKLPTNDNNICEVQFTDVKYDNKNDLDWDTLFSEDIILCTNEDHEVYTVTTSINGKPTDCKLEIMARSFAEAECVLRDIIENP